MQGTLSQMLNACGVIKLGAAAHASTTVCCGCAAVSNHQPSSRSLPRVLPDGLLPDAGRWHAHCL